jgi:hypothetical protein
MVAKDPQPIAYILPPFRWRAHLVDDRGEMLKAALYFGSRWPRLLVVHR